MKTIRRGNKYIAYVNEKPIAAGINRYSAFMLATIRIRRNKKCLQKP